MVEIYLINKTKKEYSQFECYNDSINWLFNRWDVNDDMILLNTNETGFDGSFINDNEKDYLYLEYIKNHNFIKIYNWDMKLLETQIIN